LSTFTQQEGRDEEDNMIDTRHRNVEWNVGEKPSYDGVKVAVLMDIRDELQGIKAILNCHNALAIPELLRKIASNTTKKKRVKK
jgi:hypothetical protein